jgi:hypothetical protein
MEIFIVLALQVHLHPICVLVKDGVVNQFLLEKRSSLLSQSIKKLFLKYFLTKLLKTIS